MRIEKNAFKDALRRKMNEYVHVVYQMTKHFPKDELYGVTSQLRRSTLSIILNHVEGFARRKPRIQLNFFETSYGSLQESKYLLEFACEEKYITSQEFERGMNMAEEIGAMLWTELNNLSKGINEDIN